MDELILRADKYEELYKISKRLLHELRDLYDDSKQRDLYVEDLIYKGEVLIEECNNDSKLGKEKYGAIKG